MKYYIQLLQQESIQDAIGEKIAYQAMQQLNIETGKIRTARLFVLDYPIGMDRVIFYAQKGLQNSVTEELRVNELWDDARFPCRIIVANQPGVTDDSGRSAQLSWTSIMEEEAPPIYRQTVYYFAKELTQQEQEKIANRLLGNPLIHHFQYGNPQQPYEPYYPLVQLTEKPKVNTLDLNLTEEELVQLSKERVLALNLVEMKAITAYFNQSDTQAIRQAKGLLFPTLAELEILAQTWSEHCKHKEFNARIDYTNEVTGEQKTIHSLFQTYIKGATEVVKKQLEEKQNNWLVKVFDDNAGVVQATAKHLLVWKVETHNSPSALDPYGGAITGILGNNRDPLGTGIGGAKLLFNTNVLCFGDPNYEKPLLSGQLHPKQIMEGVVAGVADGGNKSGVPTVNGSIIFDERYSGKPLVYCGTGALMPYYYQDKPTWHKEISKGDRIFMAGGRVGKDGIHGATFSSLEIDENSPATAVQIGAPIVQKKLSDFMEIACQKGLIKTSTDNGAGGLSSSIGELATVSNGAVVFLEKVPLKYVGLQPWEIFISESQERMTLAIDPTKVKILEELAIRMEVELTDIGYFDSSGFLDVRYEQQQVAYLEMDFLHHGVPKKTMEALWQLPVFEKVTIPSSLDYNNVLLQLLQALNICSRESIIRQYDHEVKGKTIVKPLMGQTTKAPQDAAVVRFDFETWEGVAISNGIAPRYGDIDAYAMSAGAFDEGIRQIISVGGQLPNMGVDDGVFWSVNDNFCVPDSAYDPLHNPDGKQKLAKLVQMCEALYDMAIYFSIPLTSGKDSMKNDFKSGDTKISIPPTILYSMTAKMNDVRQAVTSDFKAAGDLIYQLGETYDEMGASEFYHLYEQLGETVPIVRPKAAKNLYKKVMLANQQRLIQSSHDLSDGGLGVALAECTFGNELGCKIDLDPIGIGLDLPVKVFSESHSRFVVSVRPEDQAEFEAILDKRAILIGYVTIESRFQVKSNKEVVIDLPTKDLLKAWSEGGI
jgi:phosphoribosylformylglycinamidine synthase